MQILLNFLQLAFQIVGIGNKKSARLISELTQTAVRIEPQQIFVSFQAFYHWATGLSAGSFLVHSRLAERRNLLVRLETFALRSQSRRVNRIEADIVTIGCINDRTKSLDYRRWQYHAFGK